MFLSDKEGNILFESFRHAWAKSSYWVDNATHSETASEPLTKLNQKKIASGVKASQIQA